MTSKSWACNQSLAAREGGAGVAWRQRELCQSATWWLRVGVVCVVLSDAEREMHVCGRALDWWCRTSGSERDTSQGGPGRASVLPL